MLETKNLVKQFRAPGGETRTIVNNANLKIEDGVFASIIGKSGSGKSTLLSLLGTLDQPTSGDVEIDGQSVEGMKASELIDYRCHKLGFIFQNYQLIPNLTALENVCLPMEFAGVSKPVRLERARKLLDEVEISTDRQGAKPGKLSGGEQQRVSIARALANKPSIILADEPTGNLDDATGKKIFSLLHSLSRTEHVTIVVVTHDLDIAGRTDVSYRLRDGKISRA